MKRTGRFLWAFLALGFLIASFQNCSEVKFANQSSLNAAKDIDGDGNVPPEQNTCKGVPEGIPWTVVDGFLRLPSQCEDGSQTEDLYELVKVYICDEGQVFETSQHAGRLIEAGQCQRPPNKCGEYEEGQSRENFNYETQKVPCPEDSENMIEITYLIRAGETCLEGSWASNGPPVRSIFRIDDSQCRVKPPQGQNCGNRKHNETWVETETEKKEGQCQENETGKIEYGRGIEHQYICLNGTISRTGYTIGQWELTNNLCRKSCVEEGLVHGETKVNIGTEKKVESCETGFSGTISSERQTTTTLLCTDGQVSRTVENGKWNLVEYTCKRDCDNGRKHGENWSTSREEMKKESCRPGYVGEIQYRKKIDSNYQCNDGNVISKIVEGNWVEVGNTCKRQCEGGRLEGETWQSSDTETRTIECGAGYTGNVVQTRTTTRGYMCMPDGTIRITVVIGEWADKERSCVRLCPSGHSEGETWERHRQDSRYLNCPKNFIGFIKRTFNYKESFICKNGADEPLRTTIINHNDDNRCEPFTTSGRCGGDKVSASQVNGRRAWVNKCKDHPAISFFFKLGGEKVYTSKNHYPTFGYTRNGKVTKTWVAPTSSSASCQIPEGVRMVGICTAGCFTQDQRVLFAGNEYIGIKKAFEGDAQEVMTVSPGSFFEDIQLIAEKIGNFVVDVAPAKQTILEFHTAGGGSLQVTEGHPMLTADGRLVEAVKLKAGDSLVLYNGQADRIVERKSFEVFDRVYNLYPETKNLLQNLIVAEGFLTGSAYYQSEGNEHMGRIILRHSLVSDLFDKK